MVEDEKRVWKHLVLRLLFLRCILLAGLGLLNSELVIWTLNLLSVTLRGNIGVLSEVIISSVSVSLEH